MTNMMMHSITPMMISSFDRACFGVLSSSYSLIDEHQSGLAPAFCTHNKHLARGQHHKECTS